jgi:hypothetical protein
MTSTLKTDALVASEDKLLALINANNIKQITRDQVEFGEPEYVVHPEGNTKVLVTAVEGKGFRGTQEIIYTRLYTATGYNFPIARRGPLNPDDAELAAEIRAAVLTLFGIDPRHPREMAYRSLERHGELAASIVYDNVSSYIGWNILVVKVGTEEVPTVVDLNDYDGMVISNRFVLEDFRV